MLQTVRIRLQSECRKRLRRFFEGGVHYHYCVDTKGKGESITETPFSKEVMKGVINDMRTYNPRLEIKIHNI